MKKILSAVLMTALLLTIATGAMAATGLGMVTSVSVTAATADKAGSASADTYVCALTLDDEGKIVNVIFDAVQATGAFDATGAAAEFNAAPISKNELKEGYGMKPISPIGKEWYEQMEYLANWCVGKTVEEVLAMPMNEKNAPADVDLVAGCTIHVADQLAALAKAAEVAK